MTLAECSCVPVYLCVCECVRVHVRVHVRVCVAIPSIFLGSSPPVSSLDSFWILNYFYSGIRVCFDFVTKVTLAPRLPPT